MGLPFTIERRLLLDPILTCDEYTQVRRYGIWEYRAAILSCTAGIVEVLSALALVIAPRDNAIMWPVIVLCAVAWIIAMDHLVFRPVLVTRQLKAERRVIDMFGSPSWDTYVVEHERIEKNVAQIHRAGLLAELYLAMREILQAEVVMEQHRADGEEPNVSAYQDALTKRTVELGRIRKLIDDHDDTKLT